MINLIKKFFTAVAAVVLAAGLFFFDSISAEENFSMNDEQQLKNLYNEMWQALISKDISTLEKIHADEFILVHMTGMQQPKKEYLRCVREGELNYFSSTAENIFVDVNAGKLIGQSKVEAAVFGGRKNTWRLQLAFDVEKRGDSWVLIRGKASTY
ncbi:MAG: nuclear transport factor 2 family protein [Selenomonadaceae bacterium]|nr:nuclear transport factor 2 family protein [Selenomonadaceae bacterium]